MDRLRGKRRIDHKRRNDSRRDQFVLTSRSLFMVVTGRLSARYRGTRRGALHANDHQRERDQNLQHSFPRLPPSFTPRFSSFAGLCGVPCGESFMLDCK
jgi:hypothetical protein